MQPIASPPPPSSPRRSSPRRSSPRRSSPRRPTARQIAVLQCVAEGMTQRQIGRQLGLTTATVRWHLAHARERLGARSLSHAVALAIAAGLVQVDERSDG